MKLRLCDCVPFPPSDYAENCWRAAHYSVMIAKCGEDSPGLRTLYPGTLMFEYARPTVAGEWNLGVKSTADISTPAARSALASAYDVYFTAHPHLSGLFVDTPHEVPEGQDWNAILFYGLLRSYLGPKPVIFNFGDVWHWRTGGGNFILSQLKTLADWQFVQVGINLSIALDIGYYQQAMAEVDRRIATGKTIIMGIHDPGGEHRDLAAAIVFANQRDRLYFYYQTAASPPAGVTHVKDWQWNERYELAG